jgi:hypothetical protein
MNRFHPFLKKINSKLDLPQTTKSSIILEISADLHDLYDFYLTQGLSEEEASQKAQEKIDVSDEALELLVAIHQSGFQKFLQNISQKIINRVEITALVIVVLALIVLTIQVITSSPFFSQVSLFVWPILGFSFIVFIIALIKYYELYLKKDHNLKRIRNGLTPILFFGGLIIFTGIFGYLFEIYQSGGYTISPGISFFFHLFTVTDSSQTLPHFLTALIRSSTVGMISLLMTIVICHIWFFLMNKIWKIEQAEYEFLLAE